MNTKKNPSESPSPAPLPGPDPRLLALNTQPEIPVVQENPGADPPEPVLELEPPAPAPPGTGSKPEPEPQPTPEPEPQPTPGPEPQPTPGPEPTPDPEKTRDMMRESALASSQTPSGPPEPKPSDLWVVIKKILSTTWGHRVALVLTGILLFFIGYIGGRWGRSDLESRLKDRQTEIVRFKKEVARLDQELNESRAVREQLQQRLHESEQKREFLKQRDRIRHFVNESATAWQAQRNKDAMEYLHKAMIHFQNESREARGLSHFLYRTIGQRMTDSARDMENDCAAHRKPAGFMDSVKREVFSCQEHVAKNLSRILEVLPPAREE